MADGPLVKRHERQGIFINQLLQTGGQAITHLTGNLAGVILFNFFHGIVAGNAGDGRGSQRAAHKRLVDFGIAVQTSAEIFHIFSLAADAARARVAAGNHFTEDGQVRRYAEVALGARHTDTETGNNLIKNQQRTVFAAKTLYALIEVLIQRTGAAFGTYRLNKDRSGAASELVHAQLSFQIIQIIGEEFLGVLEDIKRNAMRLGEFGTGDTDTVAELIAPAVVSAAHFQDIFIFGSKSCHTNRRHARLGARTEHTEHIDRRHIVDNLFGKLVFILVEQTGGRTAVIQQLNNLFAHGGRVGAQNGGTAGLQKVEILVAVNIIQLHAAGFGENQREGIVKRKVVLYAAGDCFFCFINHFLGLFAFFTVIFGFIFLQSVRTNGINRLFNQIIQLSGDFRSVMILRNRKSRVHFCHSFLI